MFEGTLWESSATRLPALRPVHWLIALLVGLSGFVVGSLSLPVVATPPGTRMLLLRAAAVGAALMFHALALCYTYCDARRQGLESRRWLVLVLLTSLPGFLAYLVFSALRTGEWKRATLPMAYTLEVLLVGIAALLPLIYTQALPGSVRLITPVPPVPRGTRAPAQSARPIKHVIHTEFLHAPIVIPREIPKFTLEDNMAPDAGPVVNGIPPGLSGSNDGVLESIFVANPVPPPPASQQKPAPVKRISLGGRVVAAKAIFAPKPEYPPLARMARVQGTVRMEAVISTDGTIQELKVISGHPLLVPAAREAVERWRYRPTLLNDKPVEVETEIDVTFVLGN